MTVQHDLNKECVFISVSDVDAFSDYDNASGFSVCVYLSDGIVVSADMADQYKDFVVKFEEWLKDE